MSDLIGTNQSDILTGSSGNDVLSGGNDSDILNGGAGDDLLQGGNGTDVLDGGADSDTVIGGNSDDTLIYTVSENVDAVDNYDGARGYDTLRLIVGAGFSETASFQADITALQQLLAQGSASYTFTSIGLTVSAIENLEIEIQPDPVGPLQRVSIGFDSEANGPSGQIGSNLPLIFGSDDRYIAFWSDAPNLVPDDTNGGRDIFIYDRIAETTERIATSTLGGGSLFSVTDDGNYFVYGDVFSSAAFVYDLSTDTAEEIATGWAAGADIANALISGDGRYVTFSTHAPLLADDTNGTGDIYVYARQAQTYSRVLANGGGEANGDLLPTSVSADGRYIAFYSDASNLVAGDTNNALDTFVYDQVTQTIEKISTGMGGAPTEGGDSGWASISADGRYVAFYSTASNLVEGDTNGQGDVFVYDRLNATTERVSVASDGSELNGLSGEPVISADGRYVTFFGFASNGDSDLNGTLDVFVFDRDTDTLARISNAADGTSGNGQSAMTTISADGNYVAFLSDASNLVADDTNGVTDVFLANLTLPWAETFELI